MKNSNYKLLLHICCGPCATVPIKELSKEFKVTSYFFNPNIFPDTEKELRISSAKTTADFFDLDYLADDEPYGYYQDLIKGKEANINKERCKACYEMRLAKTAQKAKAEGIENFSTSLLISPYQDIEAIKQIGNKIAEKEGLTFIFQDFRPKFSESRVMAKDMNLYRQKYCGCSFSIALA